MRIDLPRCNFKNCKYCFDSNCTKKSEYERCEYRRQKAEIEGMHHNQAIKEFAERLKQSAFDCDVSFGYGREHYTEAVAVVEIDNLVKEMTEGKR